MSKTKAILADGLSKSYFNPNEITALKEVSFHLDEGEILGVIGRNGSGKSTLLKVLGQLIKPNAGRAVINGKLAAVYDIGSGFHPDLSGLDNIRIRGELLGMKRKVIENSIEEIVDFSGLEDAIEQDLKTYSQGMYLRLAFSTLIGLKADVILLDEVLHVGDQLFRKKINEYLHSLKKDGNQSLMIVSHELGFINEMADRLIWLENGQIMGSGNPEEVVGAYLAFIGSNDQWIGSLKKDGFIFQNEEIILENILLNSKGIEETKAISWEDEIKIDICFEIKIESSYEFVFLVKDMYENPLIIYSRAMDPSFDFNKYEVAKYSHSYTIPGKIFDKGNYRIDLRVLKESSEIVKEIFDIQNFRIEKDYSSFTKFPIQRKPMIAPQIRFDQSSL